jgi:hypothetical protein
VHACFRNRQQKMASPESRKEKPRASGGLDRGAKRAWAGGQELSALNKHDPTPSIQSNRRDEQWNSPDTPKRPPRLLEAAKMVG